MDTDNDRRFAATLLFGGTLWIIFMKGSGLQDFVSRSMLRPSSAGVTISATREPGQKRSMLANDSARSGEATSIKRESDLDDLARSKGDQQLEEPTLQPSIVPEREKSSLEDVDRDNIPAMEAPNAEPKGPTNEELAYWIGATEADVRAAEGVPSSVRTYGTQTHLSFGISFVETKDGLVSAYSQVDQKLHVKPPYAVHQPSASFHIGSSEREVLEAQGVPTSYRRHGNETHLGFGISSVELSEGAVSGYSMVDAKLAVVFAGITRKAGATWEMGSTLEDVLVAQGIPSQYRKYGTELHIGFGISSVTLKDNKVASYSDVERNLKVKQ